MLARVLASSALTAMVLWLESVLMLVAYVLPGSVDTEALRAACRLVVHAFMQNAPVHHSAALAAA